MPTDIPDEVPPNCTVYRVAKKRDIKPDGTPQSDCFSDKGRADGSAYYMSVYFSDEMQLAGRSVSDLQKVWGSEYTVLEFRASDLQEQGERLWRDPTDEFPGHGACKRADGAERSRGQKRKLAKIAKVVPGLL